MTTSPKFEFQFAGPQEAESHSLAHLTELVNRVYAEAEKGMWINSYRRTSVEELDLLIRKGEIVIAREGQQMVGCVQVLEAGPGLLEFRMLVSDPERRSQGIGSGLLSFIESWGFREGYKRMLLVLICPENRTMASKEFLKKWYPRTGYQFKYSRGAAQVLPHLAPFLAEECSFAVYEKALG